MSYFNNPNSLQKDHNITNYVKYDNYDNPHSGDLYNYTGQLNQCAQICGQNPSCVGFASHNVDNDNHKCYFKNNVNHNFITSEGVDLYVKKKSFQNIKNTGNHFIIPETSQYDSRDEAFKECSNNIKCVGVINDIDNNSNQVYKTLTLNKYNNSALTIKSNFAPLMTYFANNNQNVNIGENSISDMIHNISSNII
jgi:hypothetical protein